jgi:transposase
MTLALLIDSIAQRHLRKEMEKQQKEVPNHINKPIRTLTLRWMFQLLEDINMFYRKKDKSDDYNQMVI